MRFPYKLLQDPLTIVVKPPRNSDENYSIYNKDSLHKLPAVKLFNLKRVNVLPDGCVFKYFTPLDDSFVLSTKGFLKIHNRKGLVVLWLTRKKEQLPDGKKYVLAFNSYTGYFHLLAETIPRLFLLKDYLSDYTVLLPEEYHKPAFIDILALTGIKEENIKWLYPNLIYKVPQLILPSATAQERHFNPQLLKKIKLDFLEKTSDAKLPFAADRIYVVRKKAIKRKIINEEDVMALVKLKGFVCIDFEDFTFAEQVQICNKAAILISIHGAGLTNCMFMKEGSKLLELRKNDGGEMYYYHMIASATGIEYYYQFCKSDRPELPVNTADLIVDIEKLKHNISLMEQLP